MLRGEKVAKVVRFFSQLSWKKLRELMLLESILEIVAGIQMLRVCHLELRGKQIKAM